MKTILALLALSLAANLAVAIASFVRPSAAPPALRDWFDREGAAARAAETQQRELQAAARRADAARARATAAQSRLWSTLSTDDLKSLIERLRAAGFPAHVIRAIVSAQIEQRFSGRMDALMRTVQETPYWQPASTSSIYNPKFSEERQQIYRERSKLMRELLGLDLYASYYSSDPSAAQRRQFGNLSQAKIDLIQRINDDYAEMTGQIRSESQGITLPEDREKLALLEREKRADLAAILSPQEIEDYEMRSSMTAMRLRSAMTYMNASEEEFRTIFRLQHKYADVLNPPSAGGLTMYSPESSQQRREVTNRLNAEISAALGAARSADFFRASSYEFQQLVQLAQRENRPVADAARAFDLRDTAANESQRIGADPALSLEQKRAALVTLAQNTRVQLSAAIGPTAAETYAKSSNWLQAIENGRTVRFEGTTTYYGSPSSPQPPRK